MIKVRVINNKLIQGGIFGEAQVEIP